MPDTCGTCRYFLIVDTTKMEYNVPGTGEIAGRCRRNPPTGGVHTQASVERTFWGQPIVTDTDWCGEWGKILPEPTATPIEALKR